MRWFITMQKKGRTVITWQPMQPFLIRAIMAGSISSPDSIKTQAHSIAFTCHSNNTPRWKSSYSSNGNCTFFSMVFWKVFSSCSQRTLFMATEVWRITKISAAQWHCIRTLRRILFQAPYKMVYANRLYFADRLILHVDRHFPVERIYRTGSFYNICAF